jgi:hypothetical protein
MNQAIKLLSIAGACAAVCVSSLAASSTLEERDLAGAPVTRELPWDGSEMLTIEMPANVRFVQTAGPGKVIVTGPRRSVESFSADGGVLSDSRWRTGKHLDVVVQAAKITQFSLKGTDKLVIESYDQPQLSIETTGRSEVKVSGQAGRVTLQLQGFGWADLSALSAVEADVTVTGARHALVSARDRVRVTGNGSVVLLVKPKDLELDLGESGRVFTLGDAVAMKVN